MWLNIQRRIYSSYFIGLVVYAFFVIQSFFKYLDETQYKQGVCSNVNRTQENLSNTIFISCIQIILDMIKTRREKLIRNRNCVMNCWSNTINTNQLQKTKTSESSNKLEFWDTRPGMIKKIYSDANQHISGYQHQDIATHIRKTRGTFQITDMKSYNVYF